MNPSRTLGVPSPLGNPGLASQSHTVIGSPVPSQFQVPDHQRGAALSQTPSQLKGQLGQQGHFQANLQPQPQQPHSHNKIKTQGAVVTSSPSAGSSPAVMTPSSNSGSSRRSHQRPSNKSSGSSNASSGSPLKTMELAPAVRKKKRKVPGTEIPDKVALLLPESELYSRLLKLEKRLDASLTRKKMDIHEWLRSPPHFQKTLRIYVFNTCSNQNQMAVEEGKDAKKEAPSWTLKIFGKIVDDGADVSPPGVAVSRQNKYPKLSSFFKRITVYLDQNLYPNDHVILWEKSRSRALHEGFEVKRKGNKEFTAIIRLEMDYSPERFKLSPALSEVLGIEAETQSRIITALWHYVKTKKLQDSNDPSYFVCDPPLRKVFGEEKIRFTAASQKLSQHLGPLQPIQLHHEIKLSEDGPSGTICYDVAVDVPFPLKEKMSSILANMEDQKEIVDYDETIARAISKINEHRKRRSFFLGFSQSPAEFINTLVASQTRDLKAISGEAAHHAEKEQSPEFFNQSWVEDAVTHYLNRKPSMGADSGSIA